MLEKKHIIIIILIITIVILGALVGYTLLNQTQYQTIQLSNGTTIDVPKTDDSTWSEIGYGVKTYSCPSKHFSLTSYNSQEYPNIIGAGGFAIARDLLLNGSGDVENYNGYPIKENLINNTRFYIVSAVNESSHDNIIIASEDLGILKHALDTLKYGKAGEAKQANVTATQSVSSSNKPTNNSTDTEDYGGYSPEEYYYQMGLVDGHEQAYWSGYSDGYNDYNYYNYYDYSSADSSSQSSSGSSSSNVETTAG